MGRAAVIDLAEAAALSARWMGPSRSAGAVEAGGRWPGATPGDRVPCRSTAVGRELVLKRPGSPRGPVVIEACAVPRAGVRPSKRRQVAFLGRETEGLFRGQLELIDGGKVRNAMRTPRPTHPGMGVEWVSGKVVDGPKQRLDDNAREGVELLEGLDLPFPHRAGSSVCCPTSTLSALALGAELREAYEVDGAMTRPLAGRVEALAGHLRTRHRVEGLPSRVGVEDFDAAFRVVETATAYCARYLSEWQDNAEVAAAEHKVARKKASARKASQKRRDAKSRKTENSRAVKALLRQSRRAKP